MKRADYNEKIWENTKEKISMNKLVQKVKGDRKTTLDVTHEMVQSSELKLTNEGMKKFVVRLETMNDKEFEYGLDFQIKLLEQFRAELKKEKKPLFKSREKAIPRTKSIKRTLEILNMYLNALQLFKARTYLQYDLHKDKAVGNPMSLAKRDRRIIRIKDSIRDHWNEIYQKFTEKEHDAIFKFWVNNFEIERFRIT